MLNDDDEEWRFRGDDQGLIRVVGHSNRRTKAAITNAIRDFAHLGIKISSFYPDNCEDNP